MPEHQEIEWKESWRDEYLKWICGYANAHGGTLFIGKDDNGKVVGISDSKKLLEDLPNKITNAMGIIADVNLHGKREGLSRNRSGEISLPDQLSWPVLLSFRQRSQGNRR